MNGNQVILSYLTKHKYISSMHAYDLGITRLSARIYELRKDGYKIGKIWRIGVNRYGNEIRYCDYFLIKGKGKNADL